MIEGVKSGPTIRKLAYGMVGGGPGAFIGEVHRKSIAMDGLAGLVAGAFSRSPQKTLETGRSLGLAEDRLYADFESMAELESKRADGIDFAVIVTPNASHFPAAKAFLLRGIHVVCDKPLTLEPEEAEELARLAKERGLLFCVTYAYTGYPAVKEAREMVLGGELGDIRFVNAEYPQEWLATALELEGSKQASWRSDPGLGGKSNCVGDIGSHVENLAAYLTGLEIESLCARLDTFVPGRVLDDNATILVNYRGGARGLYWASQVAIGSDNGLRIRVIGSKGTIAWSQEDPNYLELAKLGEPARRLSRGRDAFHAHAQSFSRIPSGHPEGYFEAFANTYRSFITALAKKKSGQPLDGDDLDFPGVGAGLAGVKFIGKCVESSRAGAVWVEY